MLTLIKLVLVSNRISFKIIRIILVFIILLRGFESVRSGFGSLDKSLVYRKDFIQDYLMVRALKENHDPYLDVSKLKEILIPTNSTTVFLHPTPHTPLAAMFFYPFALLTYEEAAALWLIIELFLISLGMYKLVSFLFPGSSLYQRIFSIAVVVGSRQVQVEFILAQQNSILFLLIVSFFLSYCRKQDILSGIFLGTSLALKFFGIPIILFLLISKNWKTLFSTASTFLSLFVLSGFFIGWKSVLYYFLHVCPKLPTIYRGHVGNQSIWVIGQRLFGGLHSQPQFPLTAPPLIDWPNAVMPVTYLVVFGFTLFLLIHTARMKDPLLALSIMILFSVFFSPISWVHGFSLGWISIFIVLTKLQKLPAQGSSPLIGLILLVFFYFGDLLYHLLLSGALSTNFFYSLITILPLSVCILLMFYIMHLDKENKSKETLVFPEYSRS